MSRQVEIKFFRIAKTEVDRPAVQAWLEHLGASPEFVDELLDNQYLGGVGTTDPALLVAIAAKRCYMSFEPGLNPNVTKVRKDLTDYFDNILKSGHGSVLEHAVYSFAIEGVSRVFTGEMNRHRAGVGISEGSMRYIRYRDIPYWLPTSITCTPEEDKWAGQYLSGDRNSMTLSELDAAKLAIKKARSQSVFANAFKQDEENYKELQEIWEDELKPDAKFSGKKHITSMMRRIIPMGVATGGVWTMNIRAMRHICALRASAAAEEEILHVFSRIAKYLSETEPMMFGDFSETPEGYWVPKHAKV
jgi:thymidylate synthase (FAD)